MSSVIKPIHIAAICFAGGVLAIAVMVLATSATGDATSSNRTALLVTATFVRNQLYSESATPTPEPSAQAQQQSSLPPVAQAPTSPPAAPVLRSCDDIRDSETYLDDAEREFFLAECIDDPDASQPASPTPRPSAVTLEAERAYRVKAESISNSALTVLRGYSTAQLRESPTAVIDFGARAGGWANQLENFAPVPDRYQVAHQRLQVALWELAAHTRLVATGQASLGDSAYVPQLNTLVDAMNGAIDAYFETLGLEEPAG